MGGFGDECSRGRDTDHILHHAYLLITLVSTHLSFLLLPVSLYIYQPLYLCSFKFFSIKFSSKIFINGI